MSPPRHVGKIVPLHAGRRPAADVRALTPALGLPGMRQS